MPRKPAHEQFDTLQVIQDVAFQLFGRYGYEGVSIGDIAKAAQLSKGALYWHFRGKAELYLQCLARLHGLFRTHIFEPMGRTEDPVQAVLFLFRGLEQVVKDPTLEQGVAGYWLIPNSPETRSMLEAQAAFESSSQAVIETALRRGVEQQRFDLAGDLEDISRAMISLMEAVVLPLRHKPPEEVHRMMAVLARTLFRAYARGHDAVDLARVF
ncbi:MAG: TetR/AcrR family transcriptional regulator [Panacagrimonas sp.]|jgi:AcrR family transcriptional regulator|nr:TetR/AcrR family transcriptional regulator [Panacagrimonas sp.]MCC2656135.1 TetR/AcrR family transcriptional regulator [Panacagrimonas sp.]